MRRLAAILALAAALLAREAHAGVRLDLVRGDGAETCIDGAALQRELTRRLGETAFDGEVAQVIEVLLSREERRWTARLRQRDGRGALIVTRDLSSEAPTCGPLGDALALSLAILIDPEAPPAPPPTPEIVSVCPPLPPPRRMPRAPRHSTVQLTAEGALVWGVVPNVAPGVGLRTELALSRRWRVAVGVTAIPTVRVDVSSARFAFGWTAASAGACVALATSDALRFDACAAVRVGALHVSVDGAPAQNTGDRLWASADLEPRVRVRVLGPLVVTAGASVGVALTRASFGVVGARETVFEVSPVTVAGSLGAGVELP
ncbi:MAG: hypothetical protein U0326_33800 [Polyangiales bacterium]